MALAFGGLFRRPRKLSDQIDFANKRIAGERASQGETIRKSVALSPWSME